MFWIARISAVVCFALLWGCAATSTSNKQSILDQVDKFLSSGQCTAAIEVVKPLYDSEDSDNDVRFKMALAYACAAGINFLDLNTQIASRSADLIANNGSGFWEVMAELFPSTAGSDYVLEGALYGTNALHAIINPGALILPANQIDEDAFNIGSIFPTDRTTESNLYLMYLSMAALGSLENRYGAPDAAFQKTVVLPWRTAAHAEIANGCAFGSTILNFLDGIGYGSTALPAEMTQALGDVSTALTTLLDKACQYGCSGAVPAGLDGLALNTRGGWQATGCNTTCTTCPQELRDRTRCTASTSNVTSCAAAGIINFLNESAAGWQGP